MSNWRVLVGDRFGHTISNITPIAIGRQYVGVLNRPASFTCTVPSNDSRVAGLHTDGNPYVDLMRTIRCYRQETQTDGSVLWVIRFAGIIAQIADAGDQNVQRTQIVTYDPFFMLSRRVARSMTWDSADGMFENWYANVSNNINVDSNNNNVADTVYKFNLFDESNNLVNVATTKIARGLLNATNDYDGFTGLDDYYYSNYYRPNPDNSGIASQSFDNHNVGQAIVDMTNSSGGSGWDFEVVPVDTEYFTSAVRNKTTQDGNTVALTPSGKNLHVRAGILAQSGYAFEWGSSEDYVSLPEQGANQASRGYQLYKTLGLFRMYDRRGITRTNVVFGYNTFPRNVGSLTVTSDGSNLVNKSIALGKGVRADALNLASVQRYGAQMDLITDTSMTDQGMVSYLATEEATLGGDAKVTFSITPMATAPLPWDSWNLGDMVSLNAGNLRVSFQSQMRVYGFTLDIGDDGTELLSNIVLSPA